MRTDASGRSLPRLLCASKNEVHMATCQYELVDPPSEPRARELWLQHAAGFILIEDIRRYAMGRIEPGLSAEAIAATKKGIDDAVYGLMMVIDGVSGRISNEKHDVFIDFVVRLAKHQDSKTDRVESEADLRHGDGMCMGYHGWLEGDYGKHPVAVARPEEADGEPQA